MEKNPDLKHVICPQCGKEFRLAWNNYSYELKEDRSRTLIIRDCPSGGVYDVSISCPHCDYEEEL
jgi:rRNA maturation protein Nop10